MFARVLTAWLLAAAMALGTAGAELEDGPSSGREIRAAMQQLEKQYGADAVAMQGHLMGHAVAGGSIRDASVGISGTEEYEGKRYLAFRVETGIVYNDHDVQPASRLAHVWSSIVEPTLVKFTQLTLPTDGVALHIWYSHALYTDRQNAQDKVRAGDAPSEAASFHILTPDIVDIANQRITAQELIGRVHSDVDGKPVRVVLEKEGATAREHEGTTDESEREREDESTDGE